MGDVAEIVAFIEERWAEEETAAKKAADAVGDASWVRFGLDGRADDIVTDTYSYNVAESFDANIAVYIAIHDPARVLRRIARDRKILELHTSPHTVITDQWGNSFCTLDGLDCTREGEAECTLCGQEPCTTVRLLAEEHDQHPDYKPEWRA